MAIKATLFSRNPRVGYMSLFAIHMGAEGLSGISSLKTLSKAAIDRTLACFERRRICGSHSNRGNSGSGYVGTIRNYGWQHRAECLPYHPLIPHTWPLCGTCRVDVAICVFMNQLQIPTILYKGFRLVLEEDISWMSREHCRSL